jgi:very-short-patch-repair endonuclease
MAKEQPQFMQKTTRLSPLLLQRARDMRSEPTSSEQKLWQCLRDRQLAGLKFKRQAPVGNYIADFYCAGSKVVVEVDGDSHADREEYDLKRTYWLNTRQLQVVRVTNDDVHTNLDGVLEEIARVCGVEV